MSQSSGYNSSFILSDFSVPGYDWAIGFPQPNSHYYTKPRGDVIHNATFYLGHSQYDVAIQNKNLLYIVFANFSDVNVYNSKFDFVEPGTFHPSLVIDLIYIFLPSYTQSPLLFHNYVRGDYVLFYNYFIFL
jgi:hypothetical protein